MGVYVTELKESAHGGWRSEMTYESDPGITTIRNEEGERLFTLNGAITEDLAVQLVDLYHLTYSIAFNRGEAHGRSETVLAVHDLLGIDKIVSAIRGEK